MRLELANIPTNLLETYFYIHQFHMKFFYSHQFYNTLYMRCTVHSARKNTLILTGNTTYMQKETIFNSFYRTHVII